ncbi:Fur family transcriptional regulator [Sediminitomix flava]|uniref:Fur family ferric uptake transcriptional regulator n=1 Tax=Sediminitomix flava TaxID=379075 RepID=A0A315ZI01_SEDFL|nr:Fur family transcriptional regulator [Sediminitomix flava]PWJ44839.1 Fur family ferric uptake transcriptional regulator [Sediminitomix flava]
MESLSLGILQKNKLRKTPSREKILDIFMQSEVALSENDIEHQLSEFCDRATIYRTLKTFLEHGLVHKVMDENNLVKFAYCKEGSCSDHEHNHDHVHFKCKKCGNTVCMEEHPIQKLNLPEGYQTDEVNLLIIGTCPNCK